MEILIYAEVWIKDLTNLGLVVGSPTAIEGTKLNASFGNDAEAAILELTNVLEGRILNETRDTGCSGILPNQKSKRVFEEVFEYIEVSFGRSSSFHSVKRRWYAMERHDCLSIDPSSFTLPMEEDGSHWVWDSAWQIDLQGTRLAEGGWESSSSLDTWNSKRIFTSREVYRRRRWKRCRYKEILVESQSSQLDVMFHHSALSQNQESNLISLKIGDGVWSPTFRFSENGIIRVLGMRWPALGHNKCIENRDTVRSTLYDLSFVNSPIGGIWGEHTNILSITPRILIRNDSLQYSLQVKQVGSASEDDWLVLNPGERAPFFWTSLRHPELICIRPTHFVDSSEPIISDESQVLYNWSGGFDPCNLGITALRVRTHANTTDNHSIRTIRANVSIRPRSYNTGINISLREEKADGTGALFRIENRTPFRKCVFSY